MKSTFLITLISLLIGSPFISFSQMKVKDMIDVFNMNPEQFQLNYLKKGFEINEFIKNEKTSGVSLNKGSGINTKFLVRYDNFYDLGINVTYETFNSDEYLKFKKELEKKGYQIFHSKTTDLPNEDKKDYKVFESKYLGNDFIFTIFTNPPSNNTDRRITSYEINLSGVVN